MSIARSATSSLLVTLLALYPSYATSSSPRRTPTPSASPTSFSYDRPPANFYDLVARGKYVQPVELSRAAPVYPREALAARIQGRVTLDAVIRTDGTIGEVVVLKSAHPSLEPASIAAVKQFRYKPATLDGRPLATWVVVSLDFTLR